MDRAPATIAEVIDSSGNDVTFGITSINDAANATAMDFIVTATAYTDTAANSGSAITSTAATNAGLVDVGASAATGATAKDVFVTMTGTVSLFAQDSTLQYTVSSDLDLSSKTGGVAEATTATVRLQV